MAEENVFTYVDQTLKELFETVRLGGSPVPVRMVTPDPDIIELVTPCITVMLADVRRDTERTVNDRFVEKDLDAMEAEVRQSSVPYNLHFTVTGHGDTTREDRLLLEEILLAVDENPILTSSTTDTEFPMSRDISFREVSKGREYGKAVDVVVKARIQPRLVEQVPLVEETVFDVNRMGAE